MSVNLNTTSYPTPVISCKSNHIDLHDKSQQTNINYVNKLTNIKLSVTLIINIQFTRHLFIKLMFVHVNDVHDFFSPG